MFLPPREGIYVHVARGEYQFAYPLKMNRGAALSTENTHKFLAVKNILFHFSLPSPPGRKIEGLDGVGIDQAVAVAK